MSRTAVLVPLLLLVAMPVAARADDLVSDRTRIEIFVRPGCPHCEKAERFVRELARSRKDVQVIRHDIVAADVALARLRALVEAAGVRTASTPAIYVAGHLEIGWRGDETSGARIRAAVDRAPGPAPPEGEADGCEVDLDAPVDDAPCEEANDDSIDLPLIGRVDPDEIGLPLFTAVLGLIDGFNPCAMWVLLFLLSLLVNMRSRAKMLVIAGTFVLVSGIVYFAFMAAWLNFFLLVGMSHVVTILLGSLALFVGAVHVKDFFAFHKGVTLSIPESAKPGLYDRVRRILRAEHLGAAMFGVIGLAFMVNVVELLCTAGLPAIYTAVLTAQDVTPLEHYGYLALYQVCYMLDDALMLFIAVMTLSRARLQERAGRWLKLVSGVVMLALGLVILIEPGLLYW